MALATQCPFCQTTFRVAQDQLKLRGGLVRCGNCKEVFNGNDHLVAPEIAQQLVVAPSSVSVPQGATESHAPSGWPPLPGAPQAPAAPSPEQPAPTAPPPWMATANLSAAFASIAAETSDAPWGASKTLQDETPVAAPPTAQQEPVTAVAPVESFPLPGAPTASAAAGASTPATVTSSAPDSSINTLTQELSYPVPQTSSVTVTNDAAPDVPAAQQGHEEADAKAVADAADEEPEEEEAAEDGAEDEEDTDDEDTPAFVQKAERHERLRRIAGVVMIVGAVILGIALLLQATYVWRNTISAWLPSTRPLLAAACAPLHCSVGLPTSIDQLSLESSELQLVPPNQNIYALSALLRNRGYSTQAWPYLELTLNDGDEKAITRRVFTPREYLGAEQLVDKGLAGEGEQQIKLTFELAQPVASGYRIYMFYP